MKQFRWIFILLSAIALTGCELNPGPMPKGSSNLGYSIVTNQPGSYTILTVHADQPGEIYSLYIRGKNGVGRLDAKLIDEKGNTIVDIGNFNDNLDWSQNNVFLPSAGDYSLVVSWITPVNADVAAWMKIASEPNTPTVMPQALFGGIVILLLGLGLIAFAFLRKWEEKYLLAGAIAWAAAALVKYIIATPLNQPVYSALDSALPYEFSSVVMAIYAGLLTGITEVLLIWFALKLSNIYKATKNDAIAFGIGFGALEATVLGITSLYTIGKVFLPNTTVETAVVQQLAMQNNLAFSLAIFFQQLMRILIHLACSFALFESIINRKSGGFWFAFALKILADAGSTYAQFWGLYSIERYWIWEGCLAVFGVISIVWFIILLRKNPMLGYAPYKKPKTKKRTSSTSQDESLE